MLEIDGSYGEGGGQLVRTALALAAVTGRAIEIRNIRAGRDKPGLAAQHVAAVRAVASLCDAAVDGLALRSRRIAFVPHGLHGGRFRFDVGTAGSATLVIQALLPAMLASGVDCEVTVSGGTDVRMAPPLDYFRAVLLELLRRMGAQVALALRRRGYYPRGGGEVSLQIAPSRLRPLSIGQPGAAGAIRGLAHVANLPAHIATRMRQAALARLPARASADIEIAVLGDAAASGSGGAIVAWSVGEHTVLGAGRVAERGIRAEALGDAVGAELAADLASGATLDIHASDQILVFLALAGGGSFLTRTLTSHARTGFWLIEQFLPVRFETAAVGALTHVSVRPR